MLKASFKKHTLEFKRPSGTSRGILTTKDSWIIKVWDDENPNQKGTGEASIIKTLNPEWNEEYEKKLENFCNEIDTLKLEDLNDYPSIRFGLEMALFDLKNGGNEQYFDNHFSQGKDSILINGLIWMGSEEFMLEQLQQKLELGFKCIKMKIGAIDFEAELGILKSIRKKFDKNQIELRVDANGAFSPEDALDKLHALSVFDLHSIEQPIRQGQWDEMKKLCSETPFPIALDEELIGVTERKTKEQLLETIQPQFIILKPSLVGGFAASDEWIELAEKKNIGWWITSALESNVGLKALAQYTYSKGNPMPQGLGTGQLFTNNSPTNLDLEGDRLWQR